MTPAAAPFAALTFVAIVTTAASAGDWSLPEGVIRKPVAFADIPGWMADDLTAVAAPFRATCDAILNYGKPMPGLKTPAALSRVCQVGTTIDWTKSEKIREFFASEYQAVEITPPAGKGFMTGYYEPEVAGSLGRTAEFTAPLLSRPPDLVTIERGQVPVGLPSDATAGRQREDGTLEPFPDRAAILDGAVADRTRPLVWLKDDVEVFLVQVQGSTRVRLPDGSTRRFAYDGRNGLPYTSIGKKIVEEGHVPLAELNLDRLKSWLRANPVEGKRIMRLNRSYVFFRAATELDDKSGPIGGAGVPLTPWRSIAVDQNFWPYGLPVWLDAELPLPSDGTELFQHLTITQDTGSAIVGPARVDLYNGTGPEAGVRAGLLRHPVRFIALLPKEQP